MAVLLVLVLLTAALGVAVVLGWTYDSRDTEYSLGKVITPHTRPTDVHGVAREDVPAGQEPTA
jgi:hypothetical protein